MPLKKTFALYMDLTYPAPSSQKAIMYKLREYQKEAVNKTLDYFRKKKDPAVIVLPTGSGKSLVIAELARLAKGRVLVLTHVKELVEQNHKKYESYNLKAGLFSAGLNKKEDQQKVIFGSIQSVAHAQESFFKNFSIVIIDECHRVNLEKGTQYAKVIKSLKIHNDGLCILGLTATPYRLDTGWIFNSSHEGIERTREKRFFKQSLYELPLEYMIKNNYLTKPIRIDIPVTSYDFSELSLQSGHDSHKKITTHEIEKILKKQRKLTPFIVKNIVDITEKYNRKGVMIFSCTIGHAQEILSFLPPSESKIILGETHQAERDKIIDDFKKKKIKYLVNVSVLTTGFDAPHVDVIAILRPTDSVSLYQQIIGRGLRLNPEKKDCLILDYTRVSHDIYAPEVRDKKPNSDSVPVKISCPQCGFENDFWGKTDHEGHVLEHYGRRCKGGVTDPNTFDFKPCGYRFRFKVCPKCSEENDLTAKKCLGCGEVLTHASAKLKQARLSKYTHILKPSTIELHKREDKNRNPFLQVRYYDDDAKYLSEAYYLNNPVSVKKFNINFLRSHMKRPEFHLPIESVEDAIRCKNFFRVPSFIIARKHEKFWRITEKIFQEEL